MNVQQALTVEQSVDLILGRSVQIPLYRSGQGLPLARGVIIGYTLVSAEDAAFVNQWSWGLDGDGYARRGYSEDGASKSHYLHSVVLARAIGHDVDVENGMSTDHINRDRLDNRRQNLREVSWDIQHANKSLASNSTSGLRGVSWHKCHKKWIAKLDVTTGGVRRTDHLGYYTTKEAAARAWDKRAFERWGDVVYLNFPEDYGLPSRQAPGLADLCTWEAVRSVA